MCSIKIYSAVPYLLRVYVSGSHLNGEGAVRVEGVEETGATLVVGVLEACDVL